MSIEATSGAYEMALASEKQSPVNVLTQHQTSLALVIERAAAGDTAAFETDHDSLSAEGNGDGVRMLGNEADARDATQEVLLRVYKVPGTVYARSALR